MSYNEKPSIYDSLPMLDSWYNKQQIASPNIQHNFRSDGSNCRQRFPGNSKKRRCDPHQCVSFSIEPPSVHYIRFSRAILDNDNDDDDDDNDYENSYDCRSNNYNHRTGRINKSGK